jgi:sugar/nucleoside kinase (ribokinase family)
MQFVVVGDCTLDITVMRAHRPRRAADAPALIRLGPGGQAANVAVRLARRGWEVRLVAPMADDPAGRLLRAALAQDRVAVSAVIATRTSMVAVLLDSDGERTMLSDRRSLSAINRAALAGAGWVHCSGYALLDDASGDALARRLTARRRGVPLSVGGGSLPSEPARVARFRARLRSVAPQVCLLSRDEAAALLGRRPRSAATAAVALAGLADAVIVTAGSEGSAAVLHDQLVTVPPVATARSVVDATGAGDAYAAAVIAGLASVPWPPGPGQLRRAMAAGGRLGARVARVAGAQGRVAGERRANR